MGLGLGRKLRKIGRKVEDAIKDVGYAIAAPIEWLDDVFFDAPRDRANAQLKATEDQATATRELVKSQTDFRAEEAQRFIDAQDARQQREDREEARRQADIARQEANLARTRERERELLARRGTKTGTDARVQFGTNDRDELRREGAAKAAARRKPATFAGGLRRASQIGGLG